MDIDICESLKTLQMYLDPDEYARLERAVKKRRTNQILSLIGEILDKTEIKQFYHSVTKEKTIVHHLSKILLYLSRHIEIPECREHAKLIRNEKQY